MKSKSAENLFVVWIDDTCGWMQKPNWEKNSAPQDLASATIEANHERANKYPALVKPKGVAPQKGESFSPNGRTEDRLRAVMCLIEPDNFSAETETAKNNYIVDFVLMMEKSGKLTEQVLSAILDQVSTREGRDRFGKHANEAVVQRVANDAINKAGSR